MSCTLRPHSITISNTITKAMNWLKRMPTGVPQSPSPTTSLGISENELASSTESLTLSISDEFNEPSSMNVMKLSKDKPGTVSLQHKAELAPLPTIPISILEREASRWSFRSSSICTTTPAHSTNEVADHFLRPLPTYEEYQIKLSKRQQACEERVRNMRAYLKNEVDETITRKANDPFTVIGKSENLRRRIDSGNYDKSDSCSFQELENPGITSMPKSVECRPTTLIPFDKDFLNWAVFRMRNHNPPEFTCIGCTDIHKTSTYQGHAMVWLLHGCKHMLYDSCFEKLCHIEPVNTNHACHNCETFKRELKRHSLEEMVLRHERLLEKTCAQHYYCQMDHKKLASKMRMV